jgi:hypothetical protein
MMKFEQPNIAEAEMKQAEALIAGVKNHPLKGMIVGALESWANKGFPEDSSVDGSESSDGPIGAPDGNWQVKHYATPELRERAMDMALRTPGLHGREDVLFYAQKYVDFILGGAA